LWRGASADAPAAPATLVLASHDSFAISEEVIAAFEAEHNVTVQVLTLGDAGAALNKIILSKDAPLADLFFGVDNTFLSRALAADVFAPYASPLLAQIPDDLELDPKHRCCPWTTALSTSTPIANGLRQTASRCRRRSKT
jgi:thiamine transport system substrate-binding protein